MKRATFLLACLPAAIWAQEASSGFDLRVTASAGTSYSDQLKEDPRSGDPMVGGFRAVFYPTWKLSEHWSVSGAVQTHSRPYFTDEFATQRYGVKTDILQAHLT